VQYKKYSLLIIVSLTILAFDGKLSAQDVTFDTLSYYERDENEAFWIDDCFTEGYCEPVAIQFIQEDIPANIVKIEKIRFKIAEPGIFRFVLYSGGELPSLLNIVWEDSITVGNHEIDNEMDDSISIWKEIDFSELTPGLIFEFPIWFQIDIKSFSLGFCEITIDPDAPPQSYTAWINADSLNWYRTWGAEFISELIVSYSTSTSENVPLIPSTYKFENPYPNPFNPSTTISYGLPEESNVSLVIYDVRGQAVQTLKSDQQSAGWYDIVWNGETTDGRSLSTGIYFARLVAGEYSQVIKMLYLK